MNKQTGRIIKAISGFYYVECESLVYSCRARGLFRKQGIEPLVGDRVEFCAASAEEGTVEAVLPRQNSFIRPPLANVARLMIVSAYSNPAPNSLMIDKLIAIAENKGVEPILVFNKSDQGDFSDWENIYINAGFSVHVVSCKTGSGLDALQEELKDGISVLTGNSGVGKSSILNHLFDGLSLATGAVSEKLGRGRHTTRHVELFAVPGGGYAADTPGFSSIDIERAEVVLKEDLAAAFREFAPYIGQCQFTSCAHIGEKGCAVAAAVADGRIGQSRYDSYRMIYDEVKDLKRWKMQK